MASLTSFSVIRCTPSGGSLMVEISSEFLAVGCLSYIYLTIPGFIENKGSDINLLHALENCPLSDRRIACDSCDELFYNKFTERVFGSIILSVLRKMFLSAQIFCTRPNFSANIKIQNCPCKKSFRYLCHRNFFCRTLLCRRQCF